MGLLDEFYAPDYSKLKRGQFRQDTPKMREYAANAPIDLLRGRLAGLLGLPSDVANMVRTLMPTEMMGGPVDYEEPTQVPYGTDFMLKNLPLAPAADNPLGRVAGQAGALVPLTPMEIAKAARLAGRGATEVGKFVAPKAGQLAENYMQSMGMMPSIVSKEGGGLLTPTTKFKYPQDKALDIAQQRAALPVDQGGLGLLANNTAEERAAAMGAIDYLHGTERLDRLLEGKNINAKRATSGPIPFGTNEPALASNYSMNKADTSRIANDMGEMQNYFQVFPKSMGERGTSPYSVEQLWNRLPQGKKTEILDRAKRVGFEDFDQSSGPLKLHPEGINAMNVSEDTWNYYLNRESKGNPLTALRKIWGESGMLYGNEDKLAEVYKLAGFPYEISQTNAPWASAKGVMTGKAMISNPLDTSNVSELQDKVIPFLKEQFKNDRTRTKAYGSDQWDKSTRYTPKQWVDELSKDVGAGKNSYVWTSIPDKVTNALKKAGYNGIIDKSGKGGGQVNDVIIPFEPEQLRSRFAAFDPFRKTAAIAATMGVAAPDLLAADLNEEELRKQMQSYGLLY